MEAPNKGHFRTSLLSLVMCLTIHRAFQFICITRKFEAVYFMESPLLEDCTSTRKMVSTVHLHSLAIVHVH